MKPLDKFFACVICLLMCAASGCGSSLSRDKAAEDIKQSTWYVTHKSMTYPVTIGRFDAGCYRSPGRDTMIRFLESKGYISYSPREIKLTDAGRKMLDDSGEKPYGQEKTAHCEIEQINIRLATRGEPSVTGIVASSEGSTAIVEFSTPVAITPIGSQFVAFTKNLSYKEDAAIRSSLQTFEIPHLPFFGSEYHKAVFVKYDDGWRLKSDL